MRVLFIARVVRTFNTGSAEKSRVAITCKYVAHLDPLRQCGGLISCNEKRHLFESSLQLVIGGIRSVVPEFIFLVGLLVDLGDSPEPVRMFEVKEQFYWSTSPSDGDGFTANDCREGARWDPDDFRFRLPRHGETDPKAVQDP